MMKDFLKEVAFAFALSFVWALAWFRPLLSRSQEVNDSGLPLGDMFFRTTNPELLIGKGVDLFGSIWMVFQTRDIVTMALRSCQGCITLWVLIWVRTPAMPGSMLSWVFRC